MANFGGLGWGPGGPLIQGPGNLAIYQGRPGPPESQDALGKNGEQRGVDAELSDKNAFLRDHRVLKIVVEKTVMMELDVELSTKTRPFGREVIH